MPSVMLIKRGCTKILIKEHVVVLLDLTLSICKSVEVNVCTYL